MLNARLKELCFLNLDHTHQFPLYWQRSDKLKSRVEYH